MKSSHSHCRKVQKALQHSRRCYCTAKLYCTAEGFAAQQKVLLHNRKFYCATEYFIAQQKVLPHSRKISPVVETREKFILWQKKRVSPLCSVFPWTWTQRLRINWQRQNGTLDPIPRRARPNFLLRKSLD